MDLQLLKMFCGEEARQFYSQLPKLEKGMKRKQKNDTDEDTVFPKPKPISKQSKTKTLSGKKSK